MAPEDWDEDFRAVAKEEVEKLLEGVRPSGQDQPASTGTGQGPGGNRPSVPAGSPDNALRAYTQQEAAELEEVFFKGRYNRSRARLPENIEKWRSRPDIANPGPDLANFPNSPFTLPQGHAYAEIAPFSYTGPAFNSPAQYNAQFLLRYGLIDNIELRLMGNGPSWVGGANSTWGFSPLIFDTKFLMLEEKPDYFLPAIGFEAYIQTQWLGSAAFNGGIQPSFTFNFDQSLPWDIDFNYSLGTTRFQDGAGRNVWGFSFQWALQRDFFSKDFALFIHGIYNTASIPRVPDSPLPYSAYDNPTQVTVGGFVWTVNNRLAFYGQVSGGATKSTPSINSLAGFAVAF